MRYNASIWHCRTSEVNNHQIQTFAEARWHIGMSSASYTQSVVDRGSNPSKGESNANGGGAINGSKIFKLKTVEN